jgi:hypothetical protein
MRIGYFEAFKSSQTLLVEASAEELRTFAELFGRSQRGRLASSQYTPIGAGGVMKSIGPYEATTTYIHLGPNGSSVPLPVTRTFWQELTAGAFDHLGPGRLVSTYDFERDWDTWEKHPAGEEVVVLISGALELILELDGRPHTVELSRPGEFVVTPRDTWHTANVRRPSVALFITAGEGTQHRPRQ